MGYVATRLGSAPYPAWQETAHLADKPYILGQNYEDTWDKANSGWYTTSSGGTNQTDSTTVTNAQRRGYDRFGALSVSSKQPGGLPPTSSTFHRFRYRSTSAISLDTAVILGHNFADLTNSGSPVTVSIYGYDGSSFIRISDTVTITNNNRITFSHLYLSTVGKQSYPQRITVSPSSTFVYIYVMVSNVSTSSAVKPSLGEFWVGNRRSLQHNPNLPYDDKAESGLVNDFQAQSGLVERYVRRRGQASRTIIKSITDSSELTEIENAFDDTEDFTKPLIWVENPATDPTGYLMLPQSPTLSVPLQGPIERTFGVTLEEQPPYKSNEG